MNCAKSSWDIFTPNWLQKVSVTCVAIHLEESLTHGGCGTASCAVPWKISFLGKAQNPQHSLCAAFPPRLFASKALYKRKLEEQRIISNVANPGELFTALWSKRPFPHSGYVIILKDVRRVLCWLLQGSCSDLSMQLPLQHPSWFEWILGRLWEKIMGMQPSVTVPACSSVWPVYFFILACAEFVLMLQLDNFPIDLRWCEREQQHFPISAGKSHGHSSGESSLAVTLLRSSKGKSRFSFFASALCFSLLPCFGWCWWHITVQRSYAPASCTRTAAGARPAYSLLVERQKQDGEGVRECLFIVLSLAGPERHALFSFWVLRPVLRERAAETKTENQQIWTLFCTWQRFWGRGKKTKKHGEGLLFSLLFFNLSLSFFYFAFVPACYNNCSYHVHWSEFWTELRTAPASCQTTNI